MQFIPVMQSGIISIITPVLGSIMLLCCYFYYVGNSFAAFFSRIVW